MSDRQAQKAAYYAAHRAERAAYAVAHREERRASMAVWEKEHREERKAYMAAWRAARKAELIAASATWYAAHREERKAYNAAYWTTHPEERREYHRKHKAKRRGAKTCEHVSCFVLGPAHLAWQISEHVCYLCGTPVWERVNLHMDHVVPVSRGGAHCAENLRPACGPCNQRKGARNPE